MSSLEQLADKKIHFVGIGGAGMSGIARIMLSEGFAVSGSDVKQSSITDALATLGATIFIGHSAENVANADLLITSGAISDSNPEVVAAQARGLQILTRAEALAALMEGKVTPTTGSTPITEPTLIITCIIIQAPIPAQAYREKRSRVCIAVRKIP